MITGFNTDVEYDGRVFHVQTEDRGRANPVIETLVYSGGEILAKRRSSYEALAQSPDYSERAVLQLMEKQHHAMVREIYSGKFDPEGPKPFGYNIITNRSLDEVVLDYLTSQFGGDRIRLELERTSALTAPSAPRLRLRVLSETSDRPLAGAKVRVQLLSTRAKPREVFCGASDMQGWVETHFEIPELGEDEEEIAVVFQADAGGLTAEIKQLVRRADAPAGSP